MELFKYTNLFQTNIFIPITDENRRVVCSYAHCDGVSFRKKNRKENSSSKCPTDTSLFAREDNLMVMATEKERPLVIDLHYVKRHNDVTSRNGRITTGKQWCC